MTFRNFSFGSTLSRIGLCRVTLLAAVLTALLCGANASATVLFSNLGPNGEFDHIGGWFVDGANFDNQVMAMSFTPSQTLNVTDAILAMSNFAGGNSPVNVFLETDNGGFPGSILGQMTQQGTIPPYSSGGGLVTFTCSSCPVVNVGTQYWIVAQETDPNTRQNWMFNYLDATGPFAFDHNGSATGPWDPETNFLSAFEVDGGSSVPEPGTLAMLGSGVLAVGAGFRRRLGR
jgi:hypothetical protein